VAFRLGYGILISKMTTPGSPIATGERAQVGTDIEYSVFYNPTEAARTPKERLAIEESLETRDGLTTDELIRAGIADHIIAWAQADQIKMGQIMDPNTAELGILRRRHEYDPDMAGNVKAPKVWTELYVWSNAPGQDSRGAHTIPFEDPKWLGFIGGKANPNDASRLTEGVEAELVAFIARQPCIVTRN
jgi:hypothetical protein